MPAVIGDLQGFIKKHLAYTSRADVLQSLEKTLGRTANAILASDCLSLAQAARVGGLLDEAGRLYRESADYAAKGRQVGQQVVALSGLHGLYVSNRLSAETAAVEKELRMLM